MSRQAEADDQLDAYTTDEGALTHDGWARALRDGVLVGQECADCGHVSGVPKSVCPSCTSRALRGVTLPTTGEVYSETTIEVTPIGLDDRYQVAVVDLGPTRIMARIDGAVEIGDTVEFSGYVEYEELPGPLFE